MTLPQFKSDNVNRVRIGAGAGYSGDRIRPALDLIERGSLDYIVFECLAERTIALAQQAKAADPDRGYDPLLEARMRQVLPACRRHSTTLISNMGAANPIAAAKKTRDVAAGLGLSGMKISAIRGDDVLHLFAGGDFAGAELLDTGAPVSTIRDRLISANAYIGAEPVVQSLAEGADVVLGGRIADPSLFLGPLIYKFGWKPDDWARLGSGILVGHMLECAGQLSGGYFADPPFKTVPDLAHLGFPYASVEANGAAEFHKLEGTGGVINVATCKEQLLYEIHDPARYLTPDVTANFSEVDLVGKELNRVRATGASGSARPSSLKVSLGYLDGFIGEGQITYAGAGALSRAELAIEVVKLQLRESGCEIHELRTDMIGVNSAAPNRHPDRIPTEIRIRVAGRTASFEDANLIAATVESLYTNGPAAGGGATRSVRPIVAISSTLIPRELVRTEIEFFST